MAGGKNAGCKPKKEKGMKLKEKMKRFWTMDVHNHEGFTLVELIIVIAILAILAGVAVVGYSAYIEKANKAADQTALAQLNNAFALACANNGQDQFVFNTAPVLLWNSDKDTVIGLDSGNEDIDADFNSSIGVGIKFNNYREGALVYMASIGGFGEYLNVDSAVKDAFNNSPWANMPSSELVDMVFDTKETVRDLYKDYLSPDSASIEEFLNMAAAALNMTRDEFDTYYNSLVQAKMKKEGLRPSQEKDAKKLVNVDLAILVAAKNAEGMNAEDLMDSLTANGGNGLKDQMKTEMSTDITGGLSNSTIAYGMYNAWIQTLSESEIKDQTKFDSKEEALNASNALNDLNNTNFQTWLGTEQADNSMEALLAVLGAIGNQDSDVAQDVVGGDTDTLKAALEALLGK